MKIETYLKGHFSDVTVVGVVNPSIIINHNSMHYVVYRQSWKGKRFVLCAGEKRYEFDKPSEIHNLINKNNGKKL